MSYLGYVGYTGFSPPFVITCIVCRTDQSRNEKYIYRIVQLRTHAARSAPRKLASLPATLDQALSQAVTRALGSD